MSEPSVTELSNDESVVLLSGQLKEARRLLRWCLPYVRDAAGRTTRMLVGKKGVTVLPSERKCQHAIEKFLETEKEG